LHLKIVATIILRDKNGKVIKTINRVCHSYVIGLVDMLRGYLSDSNPSLQDIENATQTFQITYIAYAGFYSRFSAAANAGNDSFGIQVGTRSDAILITDYQLKTKILHGDVSNKLNYGACSVGTCATVGTTRSFTVARTFTNNSGANITVNEIGLIAACYNPTESAIYLMIEHSLLTFTVTNGTSGTVTYTISATV
jgi:hypothetical protein